MSWLPKLTQTPNKPQRAFQFKIYFLPDSFFYNKTLVTGNAKIFIMHNVYFYIFKKKGADTSLQTAHTRSDIGSYDK